MGTGGPPPLIQLLAPVIATLWPEHGPAWGSSWAPCPWPGPETGHGGGGQMEGSTMGVHWAGWKPRMLMGEYRMETQGEH